MRSADIGQGLEAAGEVGALLVQTSGSLMAETARSVGRQFDKRGHQTALTESAAISIEANSELAANILRSTTQWAKERMQPSASETKPMHDSGQKHSTADEPMQVSLPGPS